MPPLRRSSNLWACAGVLSLLLSNCQMKPAAGSQLEPIGPPHPSNETSQAKQNRSRLQGMLDAAVIKGSAEKPHADAFQKSRYPVIGPSYQHSQNLHLVPAFKSQGIGSAPAY